jgi:hypothetical protein
VYFAFCYAMSQYIQNLERELARGRAHYLREI